MDNVLFADGWDDFFAEFGLESFSDFFDYSDGRTIDVNNKRSVVRFALGTGEREKVFFMKRFTDPHFKDIFSTWRNFGHACSQARCEWENARLLLEHGIETYRPACFGEQTRWGLERKSFMVTEALAGQCLTDFVKEKWQGLAREEKEKIVAGLGQFVRRIHALRVSMPDLYAWHIFLRERRSGNGWDFAVIDLHRMRRKISSRRIRIKNLGRLHHSMLETYFDTDLKRLLIDAYAGDDWPEHTEVLAERVRRESQAVSARRRAKPY